MSFPSVHGKLEAYASFEVKIEKRPILGWYYDNTRELGGRSYGRVSTAREYLQTTETLTQRKMLS